MLIDKCGRKINYLRLSVTDKCNLRCRYCMPEEGVPPKKHNEILRNEEILRAVKIFVDLGIDRIRFTGGEPLLRKNIVGLIKEISALKVNDLSLTTNGLLLPEKINDLKNAGINRVNISLDTIDPEKFSYITRGGDLNKVFQGIDAALDADLSFVKLNVVTVKNFNDDEILDLAKMAKDRPLHIRFIELMPFNENDYWQKENFIPSADVKAKIESAYGPLKEKKVFGNGPAEDFGYKNWQGSIGFIHAVSNHFCSECNRLRFTSDGLILPCLHSNKATNIFSALRNNATDDVIKKLIQEAVEAKPKKSALGEQKIDMGHIGG